MSALLHRIDAAATDRQAVRLLVDGERDALASLLDRYAPLLLSLATRQLDRAAAEEIVQDVFVAVWQHARRFDPGRGSFRSWVIQITRRRISNELRRRRSRPQLETDPEGALLEGLSGDCPDVVEQLARDEQHAAVRSALDLLPPPQRQAVALAFLDEMTHEEVAAELRVPLGTTKTRIRRGLQKLRVELTSRALVAAGAGAHEESAQASWASTMTGAPAFWT